MFEDLRGIARHAEQQNEQLGEISLRQEPPESPASSPRIRPEIRAALMVAGGAVLIVALLILIG